MLALPVTLLWLSTGFSLLTYASPVTSDADNAIEANNSSSTSFLPHNASRHHESSSQPTITYISPQIAAPINASYFNPSHKWEKAYRRAKKYLEDWTLEEKVQLTTGVGWENGRCVGNIGAIPDRNFSGLCLQDSPLGVRLADFVSAFPAGINAAATFDKDLIYARGYALGQEFRGKGVHVALGPMTNMGRVAAGGRNWEGFGADPYLSGWATEMTVRGIQDAGVQACVKHYVANEQERNRTTESSNIDDRTLREIYTHPFLRAVQADVASVMCSYNLINGSWACENPKTLNGILKTDFGFQGYVMSDWGAQHSGVVSANNGLDMSMPGDIVLGSLTSYWGPNLTESVKNGSVSEERLDDMAERIMAAYFLVDQDKDYPEVNFDSFRLSGSNNSHVDVRGDHWKIIRQMGAASTVLLKNVDHALPLRKPRSMTLIGSDLGPSLRGPNGFSDRGGLSGTLAMGWGSGTAQFPYLVDPLSSISRQAREDRTILNWWLDDWNLSNASYWASVAEVAIVGINSDSGEGYITVDNNEGDRNNLTAWNNGEELVKAVASANNNTIVIVHSVGPMIIEGWIDHPNITAVLWAGLPGQESGDSLVDVLYGAYNPSARLPYTIAKKREDYSADIDYVTSDVPPITQVNYTEGLFIDYRHFLAKDITPRYEFGFGMSYTSFEFGDVFLEEIKEEGAKDDIYNFQEVDDGTVKAGRFLLDYLHKARWTVTIDITNTGGVNGCEVPQLYLAYPADSGEPPKVMRDFARINLDPGASQTVTFNLSRYDVSIWDVVSQKWVIPDGTFGVEVGKSSMDKDAKTTSFCPGSR
ncbi:beta-glucosidase [Cryptococcus neoformans]|nr:beta-glucosidase [Cryptococcus neoformans var. grubii AD1-7a]OXH24818.1 beta-glucosidase [Cryptococcus neoformans var. grubii]